MNIENNSELYNELENKRKKLTITIILDTLLIIVSLPIAIYYFIKIKNIEIIFISYLLLQTTLILFYHFTTYYKKRKIKLLYKKLFVSSVYNEIFGNLIYKEDSKIDYMVLAEPKMIRTSDDYYQSYSYYEGICNNVKFYQSDVIMKRSRRINSDDRSTYITLFNGIWMIFEFENFFSSNIEIFSKEFKNNIIKGLNKVVIENSDFNENFYLYSNNEIGTNNIISSNIINIINNIKKEIKNELIFCISGNRVHIGIRGGKIFNPSSYFHRFDAQKETIKIKKQINCIISLINELNTILNH